MRHHFTLEHLHFSARTVCGSAYIAIDLHPNEHQQPAPLGVFVPAGDHDFQQGAHGWNTANAKNPLATDEALPFLANLLAQQFGVPHSEKMVAALWQWCSVYAKQRYQDFHNMKTQAANPRQAAIPPLKT